MSSGPEIVKDWDNGEIDWPTALIRLTAVDWPHTPRLRQIPISNPSWYQRVEDDGLDDFASGSLGETLTLLPLEKATELNNALYAKHSGDDDPKADGSLSAAGFDPDLHPRGKHGKWAKKGYKGWTPAGRGAYGAENATRQKTIDQAKAAIGDPSKLHTKRVTIDDDSEIKRMQGLIDNARREAEKYETRVRTGHHEVYNVPLPERSGIVQIKPNVDIWTPGASEWVDNAADQQGLADSWRGTEKRLLADQADYRSWILSHSPELAGDGVEAPDTLRDGGPSIAVLNRVRAMKKAGKAIRTAIDKTMADNPRMVEWKENQKQLKEANEQRKQALLDRLEASDKQLDAYAESLGYDRAVDLMVHGTPEHKESYRIFAQAANEKLAEETPELAALRERANTLGDQARDLASAIALDRRNTTMAMLEGHRPLGGSVRIANAETVSPELTGAIDQAAQFYPAEWVGRVRSIDLKDAADEPGEFQNRGYHLVKGGRPTIALSTRTVKPGGEFGPRDVVAIHELGHEMEDVIPGLKAAEWAHYWMRTSTGDPGVRKRHAKNGHQLELMPGYNTDETTRRNKFRDPYVGKEYFDSPQANWELFTTGVESLFAGSPYAWGDDDHVDFLLGALTTL